MTKTQKILIALGSVALLAVSCNPVPAQRATEQTTVRVTQSVQGQKQDETLEFSVSEPKTAMDLLKGSYEISAKDFGPGLGEFVEGIAGLKAGGDEFWSFYVNGKSSNVGAASYTPIEGDSLEWKLEKINESGK